MKKIIALMLLVSFTLVLSSCAFLDLFEKGKEKERYTVTFDPDNGDSVSEYTYDEGELIEEPATPKKAGYDFLGWYAGNTEWYFDVDTITSDVALIAKWRERPSRDENGELVIPDGELDKNTNVTVKLYHTVGQAYRASLEAAVADFESIYPNVDVVLEYCGDAEAVVGGASTVIENKNEGAIAFGYSAYFGELYSNGLVEELDVFLNNSKLGWTSDTLSDAGRVEGLCFEDSRMRFVPIGQGCDLLYYDKEFFSANNLTAPRTWGDVMDLCLAIKGLNENMIPIGIDSTSNLYLSFIAQSGNGGSLDADGAEEGLKMLNDLYKRGYMATSETFGGYISGMFPSGFPMMIASSVTAKYIDSTDIGIARAPFLSGGYNYVIFKGVGFAAIKSADANVAIANWLVIKHLSRSEEFVSKYCRENGLLPTVNSILLGREYQSYILGGNDDPDADLCAYAAYVMYNSCVKNAMFNKVVETGAEAYIALEELVNNVIVYEGDDLDAYISEQIGLAKEKMKKED